MTSKPSKPSGSASGKAAPKAAKPEWTNGLRQLYDSVVDEPLPDSFKDLLAKLDDPSDGPSSGGSTEDGGDARG